MKSFLTILIILLAGVALGCQTVESREKESDKRSTPFLNRARVTDGAVDSLLSDDINKFSLEFFKESRGEQRPNYVMSPFGIMVNLSIFANGAKGDTRKEILNAFGLKDSSASMKRLNNFLSNKIYSLNNNGYIFNTSYWIKPDIKIKDKFKDICEEYYGTPIFERELSSEKTRVEINRWVEESTNGLIKNFLPGPLHDIQFAMLLSALYIRAKWDTPFVDTHTEPHRFNNADGTKGTCSMMTKYDEKLEIKDFDKFCVYRFPLDTMKFSMDIILPHKDATIEDCLPRIDSKMMTELKSSSVKNKFDEIKVPKWDLETNKFYSTAFKKLGIKKLFETKADLTGITNTRPYYADVIYQKAKFTIDERGAEAAASECDTLLGAASFESYQPKILVFDRPFVYLLTDRRTDTIIFIGEIRKF